MKHNHYAPALLALPLLLAFSARGENVSFHPEAGDSLTKVFTSSSDLELDEMSMAMNGQEMPAEMVQMELSVESEFTITVTDEYAAMDDGRATKLKRTFDTVELSTTVDMSNPMMGETNAEIPGTSPLEGKSVLFTWEEESDGYARAFADDDGDEALLDDLEADMDLLGFLPDREVSKGDKWDVDAQVMRSLFIPGGDLKIKMEMGDESPMGLGPQPSPYEAIGDFEGDIEAVFEDYKEVDGARCALVSLVLEVTSAKDLTDFFAEQMSGSDMPVEVEMDIHACDIELSFEGEGELLWNVETGLLHSLILKGELSQTMDIDMSVSAGGQDNDIEQSMMMSGESEMTVTVE